jgi:hypothetical protein
MTPISPADELALIRDDIARLERREAELREGFLTGRLSVHGTQVRIEICQQRRRTFCKERLPPALLQDPRLWEEKVVLAVVVQRHAATRRTG